MIDRNSLITFVGLKGCLKIHKSVVPDQFIVSAEMAGSPQCVDVAFERETLVDLGRLLQDLPKKGGLNEHVEEPHVHEALKSASLCDLNSQQVEDKAQNEGLTPQCMGLLRTEGASP